MSVSNLLSAFTDITRVDLIVGDITYRVESNEVSILDTEILSRTVSTIKLAVDGKTPYVIATTGA